MHDNTKYVQRLSLITFAFFCIFSVYNLVNIRDLQRQINQVRIHTHETNLVWPNMNPYAVVTATCYKSVSKYSRNTLTAFNKKTGPGTIAISRDLMEVGFRPHMKVWVEGFGEYIISDLMHSSKQDSIDIWVPANAPEFKEKNIQIVGYCPCTNNIGG